MKLRIVAAVSIKSSNTWEVGETVYPLKGSTGYQVLEVLSPDSLRVAPLEGGLGEFTIKTKDLQPKPKMPVSKPSGKPRWDIELERISKWVEKVYSQAAKFRGDIYSETYDQFRETLGDAVEQDFDVNDVIGVGISDMVLEVMESLKVPESYRKQVLEEVLPRLWDSGR